MLVHMDESSKKSDKGKKASKPINDDDVHSGSEDLIEYEPKSTKRIKVSEDDFETKADKGRGDQHGDDIDVDVGHGGEEGSDVSDDGMIIEISEKSNKEPKSNSKGKKDSSAGGKKAEKSSKKEAKDNKSGKSKSKTKETPGEKGKDEKKKGEKETGNKTKPVNTCRICRKKGKTMLECAKCGKHSHAACENLKDPKKKRKSFTCPKCK